jgi:tRNA (adenine22-N1)-methyltransferase
MDRIQTICSYLTSSESFADIGCDHGYCTQYMLENDLCKRAIIADVSAKSLSKAERLLEKYIARGACSSVCCDGLTKIDSSISQVLIAGMGGEEIIKILSEAYIPQSFVFQPMKNANLLRSYLLQNGCEISHDDIFKDGKFYFIIKGKRRGNVRAYTKAELAFGFESLKNPLLDEYLSQELSKNYEYLTRPMTAENKKIIEGKIAFLKGVKKGDIN